MIRLSSLIVCASLLAYAMSQTMTITTTGPQPTPEPTPSPTMMPPTVEPPANEYSLTEGNKVCLRMVANVTVKFEYKTTDDKILSYNYTLVKAGATVDDMSVCGNASLLILSFIPPGDEADPNYVIFTFIKTTDRKAWTALPVQFNFTVTEEEFHGSELIGQKLSYTSTDNFLGQNVDLVNSYMCNSKEDVKFDSSSTNNTLNVAMMFVDLQVQPYFEYVEGKENFDTALDCAADNKKGNKIVPIAVGAALAGLVIVVLIAYLIGRLKSRRQSSYEALS